MSWSLKATVPLGQAEEHLLESGRAQMGSTGLLGTVDRCSSFYLGHYQVVMLASLLVLLFLERVAGSVSSTVKLLPRCKVGQVSDNFVGLSCRELITFSFKFATHRQLLRWWGTLWLIRTRST